MSRGRDVSLTIFITFMSGSSSHASFANRFFHFRRPPGLGLPFDAADKNGKLAAFNDREVNRLVAEDREENFFCRRIMRAKVRS